MIGKQNILIITTNFPPSTSIGTQRIVRICKYLDDKWHIYILTLKEKYYPNNSKKNDCITEKLVDNRDVFRTPKLDLLSILINIKLSITKPSNAGAGSIRKANATQTAIKAEKEETRDTIVKRIVGFITDLLEFPDKEIAWFPFAVFNGLKIVKKKNIDVIYSSSPRHSNHLTAMVLKILTRKKLIIEFRDPWARSPWHDEERTSNALERFKQLILQKLENMVVEIADKVVLVTQSMKNEFETYYQNMSNKKFEVIYNGYDPSNLSNSNLDWQKSREVINNRRIVFSHIGNLYKRRNPENLIKAIHLLIEECVIDHRKCIFQFIGVITDDLLYLKDLVLNMDLQNMVKLMPEIRYDESITCMKDSDILTPVQPSTKLQLPAKFYDYICCNKPIFAIGEKHSEVEKIVNGHFGLFADNNDIEAIKTGIRFFLDNPSYYISNLKKNRDKFDISKSIRYFETILDR